MSFVRAFDLGEALYESGVSWMNGAIALLWAEPYARHAVATVGKCLSIADDAALQSMWPGLFVILRSANRETFRDKGETFKSALPNAEAYEESFAWTESHHEIFRQAFRDWVDSKEDTSSMPGEIHAYLALCNLPPATPPVLAWQLRATALTAIEKWMRGRHPDWGGHPDEPTKAEIAELPAAPTEDQIIETKSAIIEVLRKIGEPTDAQKAEVDKLLHEDAQKRSAEVIGLKPRRRR